MPSETPSLLKDQLARAEAALSELERRREQAVAEISSLKARIDAAPTVNTGGGRGSELSPEEKVRLFRSLFRGRDDVFPVRFVSRRTGQAGYAPACTNKFVRGLCELPRVNCSECTNQAFMPVDDKQVIDHLRGRHVMGVYPLLEDESCWFLAADFDGESWVEDVRPFTETCRNVGVPTAVERSRSGNGAHVWFFFSAQVPAWMARKMGCSLITETMARRHQLRMASYDRLFPNQDTLPRGGFGNLIALPLQSEPRKQGNTLFLDQQLEVRPDQWGFLAEAQRIDPARVAEIANEATRRGTVLGVRIADEGDEFGLPWERPPSGRSRSSVVPGPLPTEVRAVLAQRVYVEKEGLPSALLNQIKRLAAFQNPEFYKKQKMRLSTAMTPRVIACAEEFEQHVALPRGCLRDLEELLAAHAAQLCVEDRRQDGEECDFVFRGELTPLQKKAVRAMLAHEMGVLVAPPGAGKTVLGTYLVAQRRRSTLVLVHRRPLLDQWVAQLAMFLGIEEKEIGQVGGGRKKPNGRLDVAMVQSLLHEGGVADLVASYGQVIVDECHHVPAVSVERVLSEVKARYVVGLTATPQRRDGHQPILEMQLGPVRFSIDERTHGARRPFEHRLVIRETPFVLPGDHGDVGIQEVYRAISRDAARNELIIGDVLQALAEGRVPLLLTERRDHLDFLAERLRGSVSHLLVLRGGMGNNERRATGDRLASMSYENRLVLATGRYIGEGFDDARLDTLFLAMPVSWKGTLVQYTGRLHRLYASKSEVRIFDYVDSRVPVLSRMFERRMRTYRAIGYSGKDDQADDEPSWGSPPCSSTNHTCSAARLIASPDPPGGASGSARTPNSTLRGISTPRPGAPARGRALRADAASQDPSNPRDFGKSSCALREGMSIPLASARRARRKPRDDCCDAHSDFRVTRCLRPTSERKCVGHARVGRLEARQACSADVLLVERMALGPRSGPPSCHSSAFEMKNSCVLAARFPACLPLWSRAR